MNDTISLATWKTLYDLMARVKELAPWEYMEEIDVFAIQPSEKGEVGLVSVMGMLGKHYAISVWRGLEGILGFVQVHEPGFRMTPEILLQIPQVQASCEDREMVTSVDRRIIQQLGLKFRGRNAWPLFRSYQPACAP